MRTRPLALVAAAASTAAFGLSAAPAAAPAASLKACKGPVLAKVVFGVRVTRGYGCGQAKAVLGQWVAKDRPDRVGRPTLVDGWRCGGPMTDRGPINYRCRLRVDDRTVVMTWKYDPSNL